MHGQTLFSGEQERADVYALLAGLLLDPSADVVTGLAALPRVEPGNDALASSWNELLDTAARRGTEVPAEYERLFVAAGTPALNPYECFYREGWLMDKPLAQLRDELRGLGLVRAEQATELEDHLGALCETMRLLLRSGRPAPVQRDFFRRHLDDWPPRCLQDMAQASAGGFYAALAAFMLAFFRREADAFGLDEEQAPLHPPRTSRHVATPS